jgi:glycosyltransferase involved in cell wall biosynthesis
VKLDSKSVFVIVPSYNEGRVVANTVRPLMDAGYQVVVVDDCSSDDTRAVLESLPVSYIRHPINLGQGAALQTGMTFAYENGAEFAVHFDADGQHDAADIPKLLQPILDGRADITLGTRFQRAEDAAEVPPTRKVILRGAIIVNQALTGLKLTDAHNGFRAMNRLALSKIKMTENRMAHATEILSIIQKEKLRVEEVPVHIVYTEYSKEKGQSSGNALHILIDMILNKLF